MKSTKLQRAALYLRISKDSEGLGQGVDRQREDGDKRITARSDWAKVGEYVDNDQSASRGRRKREDFERLLLDIEAGLIDIIVTWSWERLSKKKSDEARLIDVCRRHKIVIVVIQGADLDMSTPGGQFVAEQMGSMARFEVALKSERQARRGRQIADTGEPWMSGPRPFGFEEDRITHREDEAAAGAQAYENLIIANMKLSAIARSLNAAGFRTGQGNEWKYNSVRTFLRNPRNAGLRGYTRTTFDEQGGIVHDALVIVGPAKWDGLVPEDTWKTAIEILDRPERKANKVGSARKWLLGSQAYCGRCEKDGIETLVMTSYRQDSARLYKCKDHAHLGRDAEAADRQTVMRVVARFIEDDAADLLTDTSRPDADEARKKLAVLRERLNGVGRLLATGDFDQEQAAEASRVIRAEMATIELPDAPRRQALEPLVKAGQGRGTQAERIDRVRAAWDALGLDRQRLVLGMIYRVTVLPGVGGRPRVERPVVRLDPLL